MILKHLLEDLNRLISSGLLHPYSETGVQSIQFRSGELAWESSEVEHLESMVKEKESDLTTLEKELKESEDLADKHERRVDELERLLDEVKDEEETGSTLRQYKERTERAESNAEAWSKGHHMMEQEVTALRKRKGIDASVFKNVRALNELVSYAARGENVQELAVKLVQLMKDSQ